MAWPPHDNILLHMCTALLSPTIPWYGGISEAYENVVWLNECRKAISIKSTTDKANINVQKLKAFSNQAANIKFRTATQV